MSTEMMGPVLTQVGLTLFTLLVLYSRRLPAMMAAKPSNEAMQDKKSLQSLPAPARFAAENYNHQFEAPVLFYVMCIGSMVAGLANEAAVMLAWTYVALRVVHTAIHITYNKVMHRFLAFLISSIVLMALFVVVAIQYWSA